MYKYKFGIDACDPDGTFSSELDAIALPGTVVHEKQKLLKKEEQLI